MLQGCASSWVMSDEEALLLSSPAERHAIGFRSGRAHLDVELPPGPEGFSPNQQSDMHVFLDRYRAEGTSTLRISVPASGHAQGRGSNALGDVRAIALEAGVPAQSIRVERHAARSPAGQVVRLSYTRREVVPPECGDWPSDLGPNRERVHYANFGCATQRNLALNVANPRDLQRPQPEQPGSGERRYVNWTKYLSVPAGAPGAAASETTNSKAGSPRGGQTPPGVGGTR